MMVQYLSCPRRSNSVRNRVLRRLARQQQQPKIEKAMSVRLAAAGLMSTGAHPAHRAEG